MTGGIEGGGGCWLGWRQCNCSQADRRVEEPHSKPCQLLGEKMEELVGTKQKMRLDADRGPGEVRYAFQVGSVDPVNNGRRGSTPLPEEHNVWIVNGIFKKPNMGII